MNNDYEYRIENGGIILTKYTGNDTEVTVPDSYMDAPVLKLEKTFQDNASITSVIIPDGITSIDDNAFDCCQSLSSVTIPNSVNHLGKWAFCCCKALTSVTIPSSVVEIGYGAFWGCENLTVHCSGGSYAEKYVKEHDIPFEIIDKEEVVKDETSKIEETSESTPAKKHSKAWIWVVVAVILAVIIGGGFALNYFEIVDFQGIIEQIFGK